MIFPLQSLSSLPHTKSEIARSHARGFSAQSSALSHARERCATRMLTRKSVCVESATRRRPLAAEREPGRPAERAVCRMCVSTGRSYVSLDSPLRSCVSARVYKSSQGKPRVANARRVWLYRGVGGGPREGTSNRKRWLRCCCKGIRGEGRTCHVVYGGGVGGSAA